MLSASTLISAGSVNRLCRRAPVPDRKAGAIPVEDLETVALAALELPLPDTGRDYLLRVDTPGEGLLASQMPEVVVTSPRRVVSQLLDELRALRLSDMVRVLNVDTARQLRPAHLAGLVREKLERAWFRRFGLLQELASGILGPGFEDREFLKLCLRELEGLCVLDQCCNIHGIPLETGVRRVLGERWRRSAELLRALQLSGQRLAVVDLPDRLHDGRGVDRYRAGPRPGV
jgi:hypothetical protein